MADTIEATSSRLADTIHDMQARYDANDSTWNAAYIALNAQWTADFNAMEAYKDSVIQVTNDTLDYHRAPLVINLQEQCNMIAYYLQHPSSVVLQFERQFGSETAIAENINIVKNNEGQTEVQLKKGAVNNMQSCSIALVS
jgi:hypothetical protein